ncbi:hypothetical protein IAT40_006958 [Kwoniella sp. CBS 6097]
MAFNLTPLDHSRHLFAQLKAALAFPGSCFSIPQCHCLPAFFTWSGRRWRRNGVDNSSELIAEAQEGELETLLNLDNSDNGDGNGNGNGWDEDLSGETMFGRRDRVGILGSKTAVTNQLRPSSGMVHGRLNSQGISGTARIAEDEPPSYDSHTHNQATKQLTPSSHPASTTSRPVSTYTVLEESGLDEDPRSLTSLDPNTLADIAKRFEPTLTMEDIEREEAEQAERERNAERAGGLDIYSPPLRMREGSGHGHRDGDVMLDDVDDDFGEFESGQSRGNGGGGEAK